MKPLTVWQWVAMVIGSVVVAVIGVAIGTTASQVIAGMAVVVISTPARSRLAEKLMGRRTNKK